MPEIYLGQETVSYSIRESRRARRMSLKIDAQNGLQVILPAGVAPDDSLEAILREKAGWILRHLDRLAADNPPRHYVSGERLPYLGEMLSLEVSPTQHAKRTTVARQAGLLRVRLRGGIAAAERGQAVRAALESWYRQQARSYLPERACHYAALYGFSYHKLSIKGQRSRWGSCSRQGNLNFNWRLMQAPPEAVDYVVIHELCHLRELNHSPRFWALVEACCPDYRRWVQWFRQHQARLFW